MFREAAEPANAYMNEFVEKVVRASDSVLFADWKPQ